MVFMVILDFKNVYFCIKWIVNSLNRKMICLGLYFSVVRKKIYYLFKNRLVLEYYNRF